MIRLATAMVVTGAIALSIPPATHLPLSARPMTSDGQTPQKPAAEGSQEFRVDPQSSNVVISVGRAGLLGFAGHDHEVVAPALDGRVVADRSDMSRSSVQLQFDASALKVTGKGEPAQDVPEVQRVMLSDQVLDVARYPKIAFESRQILVSSSSGDAVALRVNGALTLHGTTRPVAASVRVRFTSSGLTAEGRLSLRQSEFGMRPVSAAAGTVRVKDDVEVAFTITATRS